MRDGMRAASAVTATINTRRLAGCAMAASMLFAIASAATPAAAQTDAYPSRPITIIVPYTPGGSADVLMRVVDRRCPRA